MTQTAQQHTLKARSHKNSLPADAQDRLRALNRMDDDLVIRRANLLTQLKVLGIYATFGITLAVYLGTGGNPAVAAACVLVLGMITLPFLRVFMHSQAHWKVGNGPIRNWLLDHGISLLFSIPQTGYKYGHNAHHRYDNDFDPAGFPKDLQSTYIFSRDRRPTNIWLWCAFYIIIYQNIFHLFHVINAPRRREVGWYLFEYAVIAVFHAGLYSLSAPFYLTVYLPSLLLAWLVSAISLYMMHAIGLDEYRIHPTLNTRDRFFNWFGDNDGYHLEHSLYPNIHQAYLTEVSALVQPPHEQVLEGQYLMAALKLLFGHRPEGPSILAARGARGRGRADSDSAA